MVTLPPPNVTTVTIAASRASTTNRLKDPTLDPVIREATHTNSKELQKNKDGSVDVYFGPKAPADKEANWVQTAPDKFWFPYFRLYAPTEAYFDRSWPLPDIELVT
jgi:hypothetical protein